MTPVIHFRLHGQPPPCYNTRVVEGDRSRGFWGVEKMIMARFYQELWLPFVFNKRRILVLAIASYLALC
jgi:hypothetical protein